MLLRKRSQCVLSTVSSRPNQQGFTLIEIVVALVIFSILSVLTYEALTAVVNYNERNRSDYEGQNQLHRTGAILMQDLFHLRARPIRDRLGGYERAYTTEDPDYAVKFTRGGLPSVFDHSAGGMQRIAYSVSADNELIRWTWPTLDSFTGDDASAQVLMDAVANLTFYQLNARNEYEENWPPLNQNVSIDGLPRMIRIEIELESGEKIERLVPGVESVPQTQSQNQSSDTNSGRSESSGADQ